MSLRRRLGLVSGAAVAVAVALASVIVYFVVREQLRDQVDAALLDTAAEARVTAMPAPPPDAARELRGPAPRPRDGAARAPGIALALPEASLAAPAGIGQIVTAQGDVFRQPGGGPELPVDEATRDVAAGEREEFFTDAEVAGSGLRLLAVQAAPGQALQVGRSLEEVDAALRTLAVVLGVVTIGGVVVAAGLGLIVSRTALAPVARLTETAEHVARTRELDRRIEAGEGRDELSRLAKSFNAMLEELDRSVRSQRQLVADASHELRTPLTSLRTNIEVLSRADELPRRDRERLIEDVVAQLSELGVLVANLVDLARDQKPPQKERELRLDLLVAESVERARRHDRARRFLLHAEPCVVRGAPERLEQAVGNLLDNAAKWSPPGAEVDVRVRAGEVCVRDHGPGIDEDDLPHVFDRFYRAASARRLPGSGLDLAIVRQVAEAHGGSVSAARADGGGTAVRLSLPVASTARS